MRRRGLLMISIPMLCSCVGTMPVIGTDLRGQLIDQRLDEGAYIAQVSGHINNMQSTLLPILDVQPEEGDWYLDSVKVGLAVKGSGGIGPFKIGGKAGLNLIFEKK